MYQAQQVTVQVTGYLTPAALRHLPSRREEELLERPHDRLEQLRIGLGLPDPTPHRLAIQHFQTAWHPRGVTNWDGVNHTVRSDCQYGQGCFVIGWRTTTYDYQARTHRPGGPVGAGAARPDGSPRFESLGCKLPVLDVKLIEWPQARGRWYDAHVMPNAFRGANLVGVLVQLDNEQIWVYVGMHNADAVFGIHVNERNNIELEGREFGAFPNLGMFRYQDPGGSFGFTEESLGQVHGLNVSERSYNNMLHASAMKGGYIATDNLEMPGLAKLYKETLKPLGAKLFEQREYIAWSALRTLLLNGGKLVRKVRVSVVANHEFAGVTTVEELKKKLQPLTEKPFATAIESLDFFSTKRKEVVKRDTSKAIRTRVAELEEIEIDQKRYPLTYAALTDGSIPLACIFPAGETYFLINDNWELWEEMLTKFPEQTKAIAQEAASRMKYERDVMSYFYFVLHALPEYLKRHTGYEWTSSPRLVESQYELEPEAVEEDRNVIKKRSALTPIVDNQKHHVVVPYCSMAVHGQRTTYCYALSYCLLERGMVFEGNVVTQDLEEKLNGKDDYGLMFYTLTGSATNRGYPTFLIIFERLRRKKTRVHFHRVHPMRSKDGDRNPVSNWTKVSYKWMIGNVSSDDVAFQQGDLAFVRVSEGKAANVDFSMAVEVTDCDSHCFTKSVKFAIYEGKEKHVLGYVSVEQGIKLEHPEHDDVDTKPGLFEVRQCRSWEANPKGIWTLNFD